MPAKPPLRRCAIYTRKSSEEGLEQDFNSLHAQREACEAFIKSQQGEGWRLIESGYDDGGLSGATMERPGLKRLLDDVCGGRVDIVVVYKVDRLTRALTDFAKIVELFDRHKVSFVAVTQQFNTTTSMGRLTLNVLLSFAQFEREVTGERIRDKIAASKQKGMWMGGLSPLGYDARERKLVVNPAEADTVRLIFQRYHALGTVRRLKEELDREGVRAKQRTSTNGRSSGGGIFSRGALYAILGNPIYIGQIPHKGACYPGQHEAIIEAPLWERVQRQLSQNAPDREERSSRVQASLLAGKLFDDQGQRMSPSHAVKRGRRYRYYVSRGLITGTSQKGQGWRLPAGEIEETLAIAVDGVLSDQGTLASMMRDADMPAQQIPKFLQIVATWRKRAPSGDGKAAVLAALVERVQLQDDGFLLTLSLSALDAGAIQAGDAIPTVTRLIPMHMKRRGVETRLIIEGVAPASSRTDPSLVKLVARARRWFQELASGVAASSREIAAREKISARYVNRLLPLAFLAPQIIEAIAQGAQPVDLTAQRITHLDLPIAWANQLTALGFAESAHPPN